MIVSYTKPVSYEYNLDIDKFIKFIISDYKDDDLGKSLEDFFLVYFGDNVEWYLEQFGFEDVDYLEEDLLDDIYDAVINRAEELKHF